MLQTNDVVFDDSQSVTIATNGRRHEHLGKYLGPTTQNKKTHLGAMELLRPLMTENRSFAACAVT